MEIFVFCENTVCCPQLVCMSKERIPKNFNGGVLFSLSFLKSTKDLHNNVLLHTEHTLETTEVKYDTILFKNIV